MDRGDEGRSPADRAARSGASAPMDLLPAVDVLGGRAVRLAQGDFSRKVDYGDPIDLACSYVDSGARWVHVVDLDAARSGEPVNRSLIKALCRSVDASIEIGGGVRTETDVLELLDAGAARVVMGTAALANPALVAELAKANPGRIVVGVDHRGGGAEVAVAGWERGGGRSLEEVLTSFAEVELGGFVITPIERDGMLVGPDLDGYRTALAATAHNVIASGGVSCAADVAALAALRTGDRVLSGAIAGKAIVEGLLTVEQGLAACVR